MPSLKDLKLRISSVRSTQKITSAMKMVAASKLRRAQEEVESNRPYASRIERIVGALAAGLEKHHFPLLQGTGRDQSRLLLVMTSDRGLCGAFNSSLVRQVRQAIRSLEASGKTVQLICIGRKGYELLRGGFAHLIAHAYHDIGRQCSLYAEAERIGRYLIDQFEQQQFDLCTVYANHFQSVISQVPTAHQLIPIKPRQVTRSRPRELLHQAGDDESALSHYEYEPDELSVLQALLPYNLITQLYHLLLESRASENGARMTAMDNATRNAGDMIRRLTITYNRTRQAYITKELIEIISGAEAL